MLTWLLARVRRASRWASRRVINALAHPRRVVVIEAEALPTEMPCHDLVLLMDCGEQWSVGMLCPCGCRDRLELPLIPEAKPRWSLSVDKRGRPTLHPSVWKRDGCKSHYFVRSGRIIWV